MEEWDNCLDLRRWRGRGELGAKVENEGRRVPTWKLSMAERGVGCLRGLERRAFGYIRGLYTFGGD